MLEVAALEVGVSLRRKGRGGGEGLGGRWHLSQEEEVRLGEVEGRVMGAHYTSFLLMELLTGLQVRVFNKHLINVLHPRGVSCVRVAPKSQNQIGANSKITIFAFFWSKNPSN